jgi:RNA-directed DNA polymerase
MADGSVLPRKPGNAGGGKGPWFRTDVGSSEGRRLGNLLTPDSVGKLRAALHAKAKAEPETRFHALYDKLSRSDVLMHAYERCRSNKGAPGVDGQTFADVEAYGVQKWLGELAQRLRKETYEPKPIRRVNIPKPGGKLRPLGISCLDDRVCMMAAVLILEPIFEADLPPEQYGYRSGISAHDALESVTQGLRDGYVEVVDADLASYFDTIPHSPLLRSVARRVVDRRMLSLIKRWLDCAVEETDGRGRTTRTRVNRDTGRGIPQGSPLSPLLANLYMRRFILGWQRWEASRRLGARLVTYADDLVILCRPGTAGSALACLRVLMTKLGLSVNETKTRLCEVWHEQFDFLGYTFGRYFSWRTGGAYYGARPSKKSVKRVVERLRELTDRRTVWQDVGEAVGQINRTIRGWRNYFSVGTTSGVYRAVEAYCTQRLRRWLLKKHKLRRNGRLAYPYEYLFDTLGLERLTRGRSNRPWATA